MSILPPIISIPGFAGAGRLLRFIKPAKRGHTRGERRQRGIAHAVPPDRAVDSAGLSGRPRYRMATHLFAEY